MTKLFEWVKSNKLVTIWFISGFIFFVGYSISTWSGLNWQALDWHVLTGIATWILAGGVFLAFSQIREARKSTNIQIATALFRELRDMETMRQLREVIYELPEDFLKAWWKIGPKEIEIIEYLLSRFNLLGVLVDYGTVDKEMAVEAYSGTTSLRCWYQLHEYIKSARRERGHFIDYFEGFARLSLDRFKEKGVKVQFKGYNLVEKLYEKDLLPRSFEKIKDRRQETN